VAQSALYELEADAFASAVAQGFREVPAMTVADSLGNMATLDRWRAAIGLVYEQEKPGQANTQAAATSRDK
jgi:hypothetical protein